MTLVEKVAEIILKELITAFGFGAYKEGHWERLTDKEKQTYTRIAEAILSDPSIIEVDTEAELPSYIYDKTGHRRTAGEMVEAMINDGWKKPKE